MTKRGAPDRARLELAATVALALAFLVAIAMAAISILALTGAM